MDEAKQHRLKRAGWRRGDAADFLESGPEEAAFVELKLALGDYLRLLRTQNSWTQAQVAGRLGSSQSRVAKMEAADASVSVDLLVRSLLALGASRQEVGGVIAQAAWGRRPRSRSALAAADAEERVAGIDAGLPGLLATSEP